MTEFLIYLSVSSVSMIIGFIICRLLSASKVADAECLAANAEAALCSDCDTKKQINGYRSDMLALQEALESKKGSIRSFSGECTKLRLRINKLEWELSQEKKEKCRLLGKLDYAVQGVARE